VVQRVSAFQRVEPLLVRYGLICKSLAGTATAGTANAFGTWTSGTAADAATAYVSLTSTDFAAGDEIVI
jgi:hypothetical protein